MATRQCTSIGSCRRRRWTPIRRPKQIGEGKHFQWNIDVGDDKRIFFFSLGPAKKKTQNTGQFFLLCPCGASPSLRTLFDQGPKIHTKNPLNEWIFFFFFLDYKGKKNATALKTFDRWELGREHCSDLTSVFDFEIKKKQKKKNNCRSGYLHNSKPRKTTPGHWSAIDGRGRPNRPNCQRRNLAMEKKNPRPDIETLHGPSLNADQMDIVSRASRGPAPPRMATPYHPPPTDSPLPPCTWGRHENCPTVRRNATLSRQRANLSSIFWGEKIKRKIRTRRKMGVADGRGP